MEFEEIPGDSAQKQGVSYAVLVSGQDYIKIVTSQLNFKFGTVTHPGGLSTQLVKRDTSYFRVRINGMFQGS